MSSSKKWNDWTHWNWYPHTLCRRLHKQMKIFLSLDIGCDKACNLIWFIITNYPQRSQDIFRTYSFVFLSEETKETGCSRRNVLLNKFSTSTHVTAQKEGLASRIQIQHEIEWKSMKSFLPQPPPHLVWGQ